MESQIAALRHELDSIHTYDFVEGTIPSPLALELRDFFPSNQTYYDYFSAESADSIIAALDSLAKFLEVEGPFDGVIGFSIGAGLAATHLIQQALRYPEKPSPFTCAIFFSAAAPIDPLALERGEVRLLDPDTHRHQFLLGLPTAHIWGRNDDLWKHRSEMLYAVCDPKGRGMVLHDEGHAIPGARAKEALLESVRLIRRTVGRAVMAS
ncbi:hypothetical protein EYZ11_011751 [Aspergillus tanneri]|uniref:Serine hydrolase domain-containing protein n=1 Tax=Aspergillus tanneri TaxID=1220188 RepID=A0A4S3J2B3_9EURO|nr:hypothetical protein EYZ11_011751 [Aspergillus tanneri]